MRKILMFLSATALVFGIAGVTGATQFTLSDIDDLHPGSTVDLTGSMVNPGWHPNWESGPRQFPLRNWEGRDGRRGGRHDGRRGGRRGGDPGHAPVPEPATMLLFGCGLIGLAVVGRKRFQKGIIE